MFYFSCLVLSVLVASRIYPYELEHITLKLSTFDPSNQDFVDLKGCLDYPDVSSVKEAAAFCLNFCHISHQCRFAVAFKTNLRPACFTSTERLLTYAKDNKQIQKTEISREELGRAITLPLPIDTPISILSENELSDLRGSIQTGAYVAYNMVLPEFPAYHNLKLLNLLPNFQDVDAFHSRAEWMRHLHFVLYNRDNASDRSCSLEREIMRTFLTPVKHPEPLLKFQGVEWPKFRIVSMILSLLDKERLDSSIVYAHAAAIAKPTSHYVTPLTLEQLAIKTQVAQFWLRHPLQLSKDHWVILDWAFNRDYKNDITIGSTKWVQEPILEHPSVKDVLKEISSKYDIDIPQQIKHIEIFQRCPESDDAFCAMLLNARSSFLCDDFDINVIDDLRLWVAYDLMQRFGLTAEDIGRLRKINHNTLGDVMFSFQGREID